MIARRTLLTGLGGIALAAGAWGACAYRAKMAAAEARIARRSSVIQTTAGPLEYAVAGRGPPLMMIHGAGGGFDQGLLFANGLREAGFQIVAPSRFGYLRSAFPEDASPVHQADVLAELLDHLDIDRIAVAGGSAGAHSRRIRSEPRRSLRASRPHRPGCEPDGPRSGGIHPVAAHCGRARPELRCLVLGLRDTRPGDAAAHAARDRSEPLGKSSPEERRRADLIREGLMPISRKADGLRSDGFWAGTPASTAFENIAVPTLILSCDDDLFGTADTARLLANRIPGARLVVYPDGGHIWLGRDADLTQEVREFITGTPPSLTH